MFIQSRVVSSESRNIHVRMSRKPSAKRTLTGIQGHSKTSLLVSAEVQNGLLSLIMYNNVDIISETYEDIASGKLLIRRFQPPHSGLMTVI